MRRRLSLFLAFCLALWVLTFAPVAIFWGGPVEIPLVFSAVAMALCLVPAVATMFWAGWSFRQDADQQVLATLGGTGVRMFFVLGAGLLCTLSGPYFRNAFPMFWIWILVYYLATLAVEILMIVRDHGKAPAKGNDLPQ